MSQHHCETIVVAIHRETTRAVFSSVMPRLFPGKAQQDEQKRREDARKNYPQPATWLKLNPSYSLLINYHASHCRSGIYRIIVSSNP